MHADQAVSLDDTVVKSYTPAVNLQTSIIITLFATDCPEAQFVTDPGVKKMGLLRLQIPDTSWKDKKIGRLKFASVSEGVDRYPTHP